MAAEKEIIGTVGTVVGLSKPTEFHFAVSPEKARLFDVVVVDTELPGSGGPRKYRVWSKITDIERTNPLFPREAAQQLAYESLSAWETVVSLSREMVTATCRIIGAETNNQLTALDYPIKPTMAVYRPPKNDIQRVISGLVPDYRRLDIGTLKAREDVAVYVDAHKIVSRHLAILAMTGAGKTVTCRRILEELSKTNYPILIFDPHHDYVGLKEVKGLENRVSIYYPELYFGEGENEEALAIDLIDSLSPAKFKLRETVNVVQAFHALFHLSFWFVKNSQWAVDTFNALIRLEGQAHSNSVSKAHDDLRTNNRISFDALYDLCTGITNLLTNEVTSTDTRRLLRQHGLSYEKEAEDSFRRIIPRLRSTVIELNVMRKQSQSLLERQKIKVEPLPRLNELNKVIGKGRIAVLSLSGYSDEIRATIVGLILDRLFEMRVDNKVTKFLSVIEEAHSFAPSSSEDNEAVGRSIRTIKKIITEGRKFGVGLILISQRPARLDPTVLSQCNSAVILRLLNPRDQNYVRDTIESVGEDEVRILPELGIGEAILTGQFVSFPVLVKVGTPESKGEREEEDFVKEFVGEARP